MKLVAAKCPSCGADIDVDKDSESTKCEYCKSKIIVEDAIKKYKVEISGKVEVSNLPKLENHLKLGERYYNNKEYDDAYSQYEKACELDPENYTAVLRKGLSKSYSTGYGNFNLQAAINGTKTALEILIDNNESDKTINSVIIECYTLVVLKQNQIIDYYNRNELNLTGLNLINTRMKMCLGQLQYLKDKVKNNPKLKVNILNSIIDNLNFILTKKHYVNGTNQNGGNTYRQYNNPDAAILSASKEQAIAERNSLDPDAAKKYYKEQEDKKKKEKTKNTIIIIIVLIIFVPAIIAGFIGEIIETISGTNIDGKWKSESMTIDFSGDSAIVTLPDGTLERYTYIKDCDTNNEKCKIIIKDNEEEKYILIYEKDSNDTKSLCMSNGTECEYYFTAQ